MPGTVEDDNVTRGKKKILPDDVSLHQRQTRIAFEMTWHQVDGKQEQIFNWRECSPVANSNGIRNDVNASGKRKYSICKDTNPRQR